MKLMLLGFHGLDPLYVHLNGQDCRVLSSEKGNSGPGWTSINTGLKVANHGVGTSWILPEDSKDWFWEKIKGRKELFDIPYTYKPKPIEGYHIAGFPVPDILKNDWTYPESLSEELQKHKIFPSLVNLADAQNPNEWFKEIKKKYTKKQLMAIVKDWNTRKINMIRKLHKKEAVFGYYHFGFVDEVKHVYENDTILDAWLYEEATRISRALQHILKPENMMIVSDHGFQKYHTLFGVLFVAGKDISIKKLPYDQKTINIVQSGQVSDTHIRPDNTLYNVEDIAPTILGLYGVDIPKMDGKLLHNIYIMRKITTEEKSEVEKQLKDMGYIK